MKLNMRMWTLVAGTAAALTVFGGDAEKNGSAAMNPAGYQADRAVTNGVRVLFLGNSITLHGPLAEIGWTNNWGMAASAPERDYAHLVTRGIERRTGRKADVRIRNIADFERGWATWKPAEMLADEIAFRPEFLIVAIGENTGDIGATADGQCGFGRAVEGLLGCFADGNGRLSPTTAVRGVFWANPAKDAAMRAAAEKFGAAFARTDFCDEPGMKAGTALFRHPGVAAHPGDAGMARTAELILGALFPPLNQTNSVSTVRTTSFSGKALFM